MGMRDATGARFVKAKSSFSVLFGMAGREGRRAQLRMLQRWTGSPFTEVEPFVPRSGVIVDVGCGFGLFSALMALEGPGRAVVGFDVDAAKIRRAQHLFGEIPNLRFEVASAESARLPDCEGAVIYDVLHHLAPAKTTALLRRIREKLRGTLVVKENDVEPPWKNAVSHAVEWVAVNGGITKSDPVQFRDRAGWVLELEATGFRVRRAESMKVKAGFYVPHALFVAD